MRDVYLPEAQFWNLIEAFTKAKPQNIFTSQFEASDFVTILGEAGGIWPESVLADPARGYQLKRVNHPISGQGQSVTLSGDLVSDDEDDF